MFVNNVGYTGFLVGDWDAGAGRARRCPRRRPRPARPPRAPSNALIIRACRGEAVGEGLHELDTLIADADAQIQSMVMDAEASTALAQGRPGRCAVRSGLPSPTSRWPSRRPPSTRALVGRCGPATSSPSGRTSPRLDETGVHGPVVEVRRTTLRAGLAALEGLTADALDAVPRGAPRLAGARHRLGRDPDLDRHGDRARPDRAGGARGGRARPGAPRPPPGTAVPRASRRVPGARGRQPVRGRPAGSRDDVVESGERRRLTCRPDRARHRAAPGRRRHRAAALATAGQPVPAARDPDRRPGRDDPPRVAPDPARDRGRGPRRPGARPARAPPARRSTVEQPQRPARRRRYVEELVAKAPREFRLHARNPARTLIFGGGPPRLRGRRRAGLRRPTSTAAGDPATTPTSVDYVRVIGALDIVHQEGGGPLEPTDLPVPTRHLDMYRALATLLDKTWQCLGVRARPSSTTRSRSLPRPGHRPRRASRTSRA